MEIGVRATFGRYLDARCKIEEMAMWRNSKSQISNPKKVLNIKSQISINVNKFQKINPNKFPIRKSQV
jgi:hypothetical protein